eukprot:CAMPEP_0197498702 /NCGR_PEP_ID=MMETSP1311-20131121/59404_1 /TAXON_ID=464262 /ORGANISM="Genus nov. species nov., Strain RCC856" /LENGTH=274 /DNA_ID=CAMNT_0043044427 /DNA_START=24 /DNA_END=848 /DNA_ORIENTATION=-
MVLVQSSGRAVAGGAVAGAKRSAAVARHPASVAKGFRARVSGERKQAGVVRCEPILGDGPGRAYGGSFGQFRTGGLDDPEYIESVLARFPDEGVCSVDEGKVLYDNGYKFLDIRSNPEYEDDGKVPKGINIPLINTTRSWDFSENPPVRSVQQKANTEFMSEIEKRFPDKETPLMIVCSDGKDRAIQALMLLDSQGYTNIVGLKGGYNGWNQTFTTKLERRGTQVRYETVYTADGDGMGIHSTGAGFSSVDKVDFNLNEIDDTVWIKYTDEVTV